MTPTYTTPNFDPIGVFRAAAWLAAAAEWPNETDTYRQLCDAGSVAYEIWGSEMAMDAAACAMEAARRDSRLDVFAMSLDQTDVRYE